MPRINKVVPMHVVPVKETRRLTLQDYKKVIGNLGLLMNNYHLQTKGSPNDFVEEQLPEGFISLNLGEGPAPRPWRHVKSWGASLVKNRESLVASLTSRKFGFSKDKAQKIADLFPQTLCETTLPHGGTGMDLDYAVFQTEKVIKPLCERVRTMPEVGQLRTVQQAEAFLKKQLQSMNPQNKQAR